jgi:hypothetical protein
MHCLKRGETLDMLPLDDARRKWFQRAADERNELLATMRWTLNHCVNFRLLLRVPGLLDYTLVPASMAPQWTFAAMQLKKNGSDSDRDSDDDDDDDDDDGDVMMMTKKKKSSSSSSSSSAVLTASDCTVLAPWVRPHDAAVEPLFVERIRRSIVGHVMRFPGISYRALHERFGGLTSGQLQTMLDGLLAEDRLTTRVVGTRAVSLFDSDVGSGGGGAVSFDKCFFAQPNSLF